MLEPHSQKREDILYSGEFRDGIRKPILLNSLDKIETKLIQTKPGDVIIFDDNLLHGGALNKGKNTRVSIEFTMIVNR